MSVSGALKQQKGFALFQELENIKKVEFDSKINNQTKILFRKVIVISGTVFTPSRPLDLDTKFPTTVKLVN